MKKKKTSQWINVIKNLPNKIGRGGRENFSMSHPMKRQQIYDAKNKDGGWMQK